MKRSMILSYMLAGAVGAITVLGVEKYTSKESAQHDKQPTAMRVGLSGDTPTKMTLANHPTSFNLAATKATPAVVKIKSLQTTARTPESDNPFQWFFGNGMEEYFSPRMGAGSGVIISSDGYIVTNNHVVENGDEFEIILDDKRVFKGSKVGMDKRVVLAVG